MKTEKGSALFIILIGVVLFAALSYAVAQMINGGNPHTIDQETVKLRASEVVDYGRTIRQVVQTLKINGCADADISFENDIVAGYDHAGAVPENCMVFNPHGGGLNWPSTPPGLNDGSPYEFKVIRVEGVGDDANSDVHLLLRNISRDACRAINKMLGVNGGEPLLRSNAAAYSGPVFKGTFPTVTSPYADTGTAMNGVTAGCLTFEGSPDIFYFYQVLIPR